MFIPYTVARHGLGKMYTSFAARQRLGKNFPSAMDKHATIAVLLETVFSTRSVRRGYKKDNYGNRVISARESVWKRETVGREPPFRQDLSA
jgi:hypothetical protein